MELAFAFWLDSVDIKREGEEFRNDDDDDDDTADGQLYG